MESYQTKGEKAMIPFGYAISFGASRHEKTSVKTFAMVSFVEAVSHDEAVGKAISLAKEAYPQSDNYSSHWGLAAGVSLSPEYINQKLREAHDDNSRNFSQNVV
jgi:hypothetical protein